MAELENEASTKIIPEIDEEFKNFIPPLSKREYEQLEENILRDGCKSPISVWKGTNKIIDGYNRFDICTKHGLPYDVVEIELADRDEAKLWMITNQFGQRELTPYARAELALSVEYVFHKKGLKNKSIAGKIGARLKKDLTNLSKAGELEGKSEEEKVEIEKINTRKILAEFAEISEGSMAKAMEIRDKASDEQKLKLRTDKSVRIDSIYKVIKEKEREAKPKIEETVASQPEQPKNPKADFFKLISNFALANPEYETAEILRRILLYEGTEHSPEVRSHLIANFEVLRKGVIGNDSDEVFAETVREYMENSESKLALCISEVLDTIIASEETITKTSVIDRIDSGISNLRNYLIDKVECEYEKSEESGSSEQQGSTLHVVTEVVREVGEEKGLLEEEHEKPIEAADPSLTEEQKIKNLPTEKETKVDKPVDKPNKAPKKSGLKEVSTQKKHKTSSFEITPAFFEVVKQLQEKHHYTHKGVVEWLLDFTGLVKWEDPIEKPPEAAETKTKNLGADRSQKERLEQIRIKNKLQSKEDVLWKLYQKSQEIPEISTVSSTQTPRIHEERA